MAGTEWFVSAPRPPPHLYSPNSPRRSAISHRTLEPGNILGPFRGPCDTPFWRPDIRRYAAKWRGIWSRCTRAVWKS